MQGGSLIDVQWLGEYQSNVRRIRISEDRSGTALWELKASDGSSFPLWTVHVHDGLNPVLPEGLLGAEIVAPGSKMFRLHAGRTYRVDLWTYKDWSVPRHVFTTFTLPAPAAQ